MSGSFDITKGKTVSVAKKEKKRKKTGFKILLQNYMNLRVLLHQKHKSFDGSCENVIGYHGENLVTTSEVTL